MNDSLTQLPWWLPLTAGMAVALAAWIVLRTAATVPADDRRFQDPLPWALRAVWWPVRWIAHLIGPRVGAGARGRLRARLRHAGLGYTLRPEEFIASQLVAAFAAAGAAAFVLTGLRLPGSGGLGAATPALCVAAGALAFLYPLGWMRDRTAARRRDLLKSLPFYLDLITLCVEGGLNLQGALQQAVDKGPPGVLRDEWRWVLRDIRAGKPRAQALRDMAERLREPAVTHVVSAALQAEAMGMNLGPVLRAQADQRRTERFLRAEKLALQAPVKMLFPLIAFIFPCTFLVLFFPIVMKLMHAGL